MQKESSQSTKTGFAPSSQIAPTVATKVFAAVMTSSPFLIPKVFKLNFIASVPEFTPTAYFVPMSFANFFSNSKKGFPRVKSPDFTNFFSLDHKSGQLPNCCGSMNILLSLKGPLKFKSGTSIGILFLIFF